MRRPLFMVCFKSRKFYYYFNRIHSLFISGYWGNPPSVPSPWSFPLIERMKATTLSRATRCLWKQSKYLACGVFWKGGGWIHLVEGSVLCLNNSAVFVCPEEFPCLQKATSSKLFKTAGKWNRILDKGSLLFYFITD